jgi:DNA-binding response OmpR family regulator
MNGKSLVVVVVDDEERATKLVRQFLAPNRCEIHEARDGSEGIEVIRGVRPDVVILDVRIPGVHGYDVCRIIKKDPDTRDAKILVISGLMSETDRKWALDCGADETLQKPFGADELVGKILDMAAKEVC